MLVKGEKVDLRRLAAQGLLRVLFAWGVFGIGYAFLLAYEQFGSIRSAEDMVGWHDLPTGKYLCIESEEFTLRARNDQCLKENPLSELACRRWAIETICMTVRHTP